MPEISFTQLLTLIGVVTTSIVSIISLILTHGTRAEVVNVKQDLMTKVDNQTDVIKAVEKNTDGRATSQDNMIATLLAEVKGLTRHIGDQETARQVLVAEKGIETKVAEAVAAVNMPTVAAPIDVIVKNVEPVTVTVVDEKLKIVKP